MSLEGLNRLLFFASAPAGLLIFLYSVWGEFKAHPRPLPPRPPLSLALRLPLFLAPLHILMLSPTFVIAYALISRRPLSWGLAAVVAVLLLAASAAVSRIDELLRRCGLGFATPVLGRRGLLLIVLLQVPWFFWLTRVVAAGAR